MAGTIIRDTAIYPLIDTQVGEHISREPYSSILVLSNRDCFMTTDDEVSDNSFMLLAYNYFMIHCPPGGKLHFTVVAGQDPGGWIRVTEADA